MPKSFLVYGRPGEVRRDYTAIVQPMTHWTCGWPDRIQKGDAVWIVTVFDDRLTLVAPIRVGAIVSYEKARARCGKPLNFFVPAEHMTDAYITQLKKWETYLGQKVSVESVREVAKNDGGMIVNVSGYDPYEKKPHHMFAAEGTEEFSKFLDISARAADLEFNSPTGKTRLKVKNGEIVDPQQLRAMRELTDDSAVLLRNIWDDAGPGLREIPAASSSGKAAKSPLSKTLRLEKADDNELRRLKREFPEASAKRKQRIIETVERGGVGNAMKKLRGHKCQICEATGLNPTGFVTRRGPPYTEAHHVEEVGKGGGLGAENIVVLCANHHRQMHFGNVALAEKTADKFVFRIDGKQVAVARYSGYRV